MSLDSVQPRASAKLWKTHAAGRNPGARAAESQLAGTRKEVAFLAQTESCFTKP